MDVDHLQDRIHWGLNRTANILGHLTDAYRPRGGSKPLHRSNRYLRLHAAFGRADGNFSQSVGYGVPVWRGYFDASYTQVGDYLVQRNEVWFIVSQQSLLPVLCVKTNQTITITRPIAPGSGNTYDLAKVGSVTEVISNWPASVLGIGTEGKPPTRLPGDARIATAIALLPSVHGHIVRPTDMIVDETGTTGMVVAAELSALGWRLNIHQVTT